MSTEYLDIAQYATPKEPEKTRTDTSVKITKGTSVTSAENMTKKAQEYFHAMVDNEAKQIHCPLSPQKHKNNDANPSCSMKRNGDYLNFNCFACGAKASLYFGAAFKKKSGISYEYSVVEIDRDELLTKLKKGLTSTPHITNEMVRLLPELKKEEKKDD